jgi:hypothetical protein
MPDDSIESRGTTCVENVCREGGRCLAVRYRGVADGRPAGVVREVLPDYSPAGGYRMAACPSLYSGQTVTAAVSADEMDGQAVDVCLYVRVWGADDALSTVRGPVVRLEPGAAERLSWTLDLPAGCPVAWIGLEIASRRRAQGTLYLDWLTWDGAPDIALTAQPRGGRRWLGAWVQACDTVLTATDHDYRLIQNQGTGMLIQGTREWRDYVVRARVTPHLVDACGIAARVQGLRRYLALELVRGGGARLVRKLDGTHVLAQQPFAWELGCTYALELRVEGPRVTANVDGSVLFELEDDSPLQGGAMALCLELGRAGFDDVTVSPAG